MTAAVQYEAPVKVTVQLGADVPQQEVRMEVKALYESVTNAIIKEMEAGAVPWVNSCNFLPNNILSLQSRSGKTERLRLALNGRCFSGSRIASSSAFASRRKIEAGYV
jgi:hypothetical protein